MTQTGWMCARYNAHILPCSHRQATAASKVDVSTKQSVKENAHRPLRVDCRERYTSVNFGCPSARGQEDYSFLTLKSFCEMTFRSLNVRMANYGCTNTDDLLTLGELTSERGFQETRLGCSSKARRKLGGGR